MAGSADFSGVLNPKRVIEKRLAGADTGNQGNEAAAGEPSGSMSQAQFTQGRKRTPAEEAIRQQKLVEKLRSRGHQDFQASGGY